jgi:glutamate-5-semialdehyde dehydrogenase
MMTTTATSLENEIVHLSRRAKGASRRLAGLSTEAKNSLLENLADRLSQPDTREKLLAANARDLEAGVRKGLTGALLDRLKLDPKRMDSMIQGLREVARLPDPVGVDRQSWTRPNGLQVAKRTIPLGVIGIIYEARPNVTIDAFALCFKAGNATVLKGGSEAIHSNRALVELVSGTLAPAGLSDACRLVDTTDRKAISILVRQEEFIDLIIPRGGEGLIRLVAETSRIPVIKHYKGVCNIYVDEEADLEKALTIAENAKISRPAVCNAVENLLIHEKAADRFLPRFAQRMDQFGVELRGDDRTREVLPGVTPATEEDYHEEFLDLILAVRVVSDMDEAIAHIETYGSDHTEAIVTENPAAGQAFLNRVNSSVVLVNASTRFSDGGELGLGAEIGISTTRLHAYGPMGLESLVTEKFVIVGDGQIRE